MWDYPNLLSKPCALIKQAEVARTRLAFALAALCLLSLAACNSRPPETSQVNTSSSPTPALLPTPTNDGGYGWVTDNRHMKLSDYQGKVVVLDFYATWCQPCREAAPHMVALQKRFGQQGLQIVGLNVGGPEDLDEVPGFAREFGIQYPLGIPDTEFTDMQFSGEDGIPQAFVFDRRGRLAKRFIGYDETIPAELERIVQSALAAAAD